MAWLSAVWQLGVSPTVLHVAWAHARRNRQYNRQFGAAGAYFTAISYAGWTAPAHDIIIITRNGTRLDLRRIAPRTVVRCLTDDYAVVSAAKSSVASKNMDDGSSPASTGGHAVVVREDDVKCRDKAVPWYAPSLSHRRPRRRPNRQRRHCRRRAHRWKDVGGLSGASFAKAWYRTRLADCATPKSPTYSTVQPFAQLDTICGKANAHSG